MSAGNTEALLDRAYEAIQATISAEIACQWRPYLVKVSGVPDEKDLARLRKGIRLDSAPTAPIEASIVRISGNNCFLSMKLVEGKNRHIKRVCEIIRHPVIRLARTHFGMLNLKDVPLGEFRYLTPREIQSLKALVPDTV